MRCQTIDLLGYETACDVTSTQDDFKFIGVFVSCISLCLHSDVSCFSFHLILRQKLMGKHSHHDKAVHYITHQDKTLHLEY